jgi:ubiquinone/menaquinone biosynthesis C-methylase UbiE
MSAVAAHGLYLARQISMSAMITPVMRVWHFLLNPRNPPNNGDMKVFERRYRDLLKRDWDNVERGYYPRSLLFDFPRTQDLKHLPRGVLEFPRIFLRRARKKFDDLPQIEHRAIYPDYYLRNFHWQTDGWFSDHSAKLYDISVEALFVGTADVMRRMVIPPIVDSMRGVDHPRILDVACGTGHFLAQLSRAMPNARLYGLDLSPPYLKEAQNILSGVPGVSLVAENAEAMSFRDQSFDAVTSIFLFHELPADARHNVMREMFRVVRPGGIVVISDSAQPSDSPELTYFLECFPVLYHEPYFKSYARHDLGDALREVGFEVLSSEPSFVSKMVVARRPT